MNRNNPGTRLTLDLLRRFLTEMTSQDKPNAQDFADESGESLYSASTIARTLKLLEDEGWIVRTGGGFGFSKELQSLICSYGSSISTSPLIAPLVRDLAETTGESAAFAIWQGEGVRFSSKCEMSESFHYIPLGELNRYNLHNAFNITCLAYLDGSARKKIFLENNELSLIQSLDKLEAITTDIRRDSSFYWVDKVARITAPVFYGGNVPAGVVGISFFHNIYSENQIARLRQEVVQSAEEITGSLS